MDNIRPDMSEHPPIAPPRLRKAAKLSATTVTVYQQKHLGLEKIGNSSLILRTNQKVLLQQIHSFPLSSLKPVANKKVKIKSIINLACHSLRNNMKTFILQQAVHAAKLTSKEASQYGESTVESTLKAALLNRSHAWFGNGDNYNDNDEADIDSKDWEQ